MRRDPLHLGRTLDRDATPVGVAAHDLTTHGVIVGMTGSGKTGLGVVLLEEVLSSGIPALVIDPKGDMGNLALLFPDLAPSDFRPWVDEGEALREGITSDALAERTARSWKEGLAASGIGPERLRHLRDSVDVRIFTPGSSAGTPLNVLGDLRPPDLPWDGNEEVLREEIEGLASGLLVLAGIEADPLTSPEHILLANLVEHAWRSGQTLDLAALIGGIQSPPFRRLGVFELEAFYPAKDRMALALRLNGLVASPSFGAWLEGDPLDVDSLLRGPDGRPRAAVVYLAHLSDVERQFVVTLLLSKVVTWMRRQGGTSDLRSLLYIDELFGFAPPTAEPASKRPLMTLFKQARAHGLGVVVATQNPVDMDYKLMSNAGTWMVGRLQTERDKARIIEALRSASGDVDVAHWGRTIGELGKRQFLLKTSKASEPTLFTTRWAMSFLRGPLTRMELQRLGPGTAGAGRPSGGPTPPGAAPSSAPSAEPAFADDESPVAPSVATDVSVRYLDPGAPWAGAVGVRSPGRRLEAGVAVRVHLLFDETAADLRHEEEWEAVIFPITSEARASQAVTVDHDGRDFRAEPPEAARYVLPVPAVDRSTTFKTLRGELLDDLHRQRTVEILRNAPLELYARVGESEEAFHARCLETAEDRADEEAARLRGRVESKLETIRRRAAQSERRLRELDVEVGQRKQQELLAGAGELMSMFLGGRRRTRSLTGAMSRRGLTVRSAERLRSAEEKLEDDQRAMADLEQELADDLSAIWDKWRAVAGEIETMEVGLEKNDIRVDEILLFWAPTGP